MNLHGTLTALHAAQVEFVLIGGAAFQLQGGARPTEDLDFCYSRTTENIRRLAEALEPFHPRLRNAPEGLPFRFDASTIAHGLNFTLNTDLGAMDFLGEVSGIGDYAKVKAASELIVVLGIPRQVLTLEGLLKAKLAAGREKDLEAIKEIESLLEIHRRTGMGK
ncbi:MAG TPA: nucleotidyl transferase AbiEii/AbiGii toxin family protein [Candidatus Acidoferrum sp.]|nr:nucleotidyl transferase AbiEii/AbiGii toxin family protein [Candidatus Acidoferrum sp.]